MTAVLSSHLSGKPLTDTKITQKAERYEQMTTKNKRTSQFIDQ